MSFKIWAFAAATIGLLAGVYAIRKTHWKSGAWLLCCSLLVFAGGAVTIGSLSPSVSDSFNFTQQLAGVTNQLAMLQFQVSQTIGMKQEVSQTVNVITKVEREIANIKESIKQFYDHARGTIFRKKDKGERVRVFRTNNTTVVYFELDDIPLPQSVIITHKRGTFSPATHSIFHNIVQFHIEDKTDTILKNDKDFYYIRYFKDAFSTNTLMTLEDMKYIGTSNYVDRAVYKRKKPNQSIQATK